MSNIGQQQEDNQYIVTFEDKASHTLSRRCFTAPSLVDLVPLVNKHERDNLCEFVAIQALQFSAFKCPIF